MPNEHENPAADDWLAVLADACAASSQKRVADRLGVSSTVVNQCLKRKYTGDTARVAALVERVLVQRRVQCPVLGEIPAETCRAHQRSPYSPFNSTLVQLYRACRNRCPNSSLKKGE